MKFVVDASVVVKWFVEEDQHEQARDLLRSDDTLLAPDLIVLEITNVIWKKTIRSQIDRSQAEIIAAAVRQGEPQLYPSMEFSERALEMALSLNHPIYDCVYLACAEHFDCQLITADQRLCKAAENTEFESLVRHLRDGHPKDLRQEDRPRLIILESKIEDIIRAWGNFDRVNTEYD